MMFIEILLCDEMFYVLVIWWSHMSLIEGIHEKVYTKSR